MSYIKAEVGNLLADKQPPNIQAMRKLPIPPIPMTAYTTKTSKQKKTNEDKQAKKKELDRATVGRGFGGRLERSGDRVGGTWKLYLFKFSS